MANKSIFVNKYARGIHKKDSPYSYFEGEWSEVEKRCEEAWAAGKFTPGKTVGVILLHVEPDGFMSGLCQLKPGDKLIGTFKPRREGETPRKEVLVESGEKIAAAFVDIVCYTSELLAQDGDNDYEGVLEIISVNASAFHNAPIKPETLIANHLGLDGGTATGMTDSEFVEELRKAVLFHNDKAMCG